MHPESLRWPEGVSCAIYTDEWPPCRCIAGADTRQETVNHRAEEWVRDLVHTNSIVTRGLFNRALIGSYR